MKRITFVFLAGVVFSAPLFAQRFDPASVRSSTCQPPDYNCGYKAPDAETARSVPVVPAVQHRGLPSSADLAPSMPPVSNQGQQNSCVAWSTAYAMRSYHEQKERKWGYDAPVTGGRGDHVFSPAFIYNQINGGRDQGSVIEHALELMVRDGAAPWSVMPYSDRDYRTQPNAQQRAAAASFKLERYMRLPAANLDSIKAELAAGRPVVFGMAVDEAFYELQSQVYDRSGGKNYGGHAMTLVGYDDSKKSPNGHRGAFKIINSWGTGWGDRGYGWISYQQWIKLQPWALAVQPKASTPSPAPPETQEDTDENPVELSPPSEVNATKGSFADKIVVSWSSVKGAAAYTIVRAEPESDDFQVLGYSQTTSYEDKAVQPNTAYRYRIAATGDNDLSSDVDASPTAEGSASANSGKPEQVTGLEAAVGSNAGRSIVNLKWTQTPLALSYEIMRYDSGTWKPAGTSAVPQFTDYAPPANATVAYAVRGVGNARGKWSRTVVVKIAGQTTPPAAPQNLRVSQGMRDRISVEWDAAAGAQKYFVFRYSYNNSAWDPAPRQTTEPKLEDMDAQAVSGQAFAYTVVAANAAGNSPFSAPAAGRANPNAERGVTLEPPLTVSGGVQNSVLTLNWSAVKGANEYSIFRKKKGSKPEFVTSVPGTSYSATYTGAPGELYMYTVRAKSAFGGESADSHSVAAFVNAVRPVVNERRISDEGLDRFAGNWSGKFLEGGAKPHVVNMRLTGREQKVQGSVRIDNDLFGFRGPYARGANSIVTDEVEISLLDFGLIEVRFKSAQFGEVTAVLERDK